MKSEYINNDFVKYHFEINPQEFEFFLQKSFDSVKNDIKIKGFRKGFVTRLLCEKHFGERFLYQKAITFLIDNKINEILAKDEKKIMGQPELVDFDLNKIERDHNFNLIIKFALKPKIELCDYKSINVNKDQGVIVTEEEIDKSIRNWLNIAFKEQGFKIDNKYCQYFFDLEIRNKNIILFNENDICLYGSDQQFDNIINYLSSHIIGMKEKETRNLKIKFPDTFANLKLSGHNLKIKVFLNRINVISDIDLNNDLINQLNLSENFPDIKNLRDYFRTQLQFNKKEVLKKKEIQNILEYLLKNSIINIPQYLLQNHISTTEKKICEQLKNKDPHLKEYLQQNNLSETDFKKQMSEETIKKLKIEFLLEEIAIKENIRILDNEIQDFYQKLFRSSNMQNLEDFQKKYNIDYIKTTLLQNKVIDFLWNNCSVNKNS
ncbi:MAG: trigger factor [Candidatus Phytoplasma australasiaticum]|uniref:trigger factor n=1 Tax=Candidatus Phytoplasma australasiaticum TaxID=2754999 RepID=UPI002712D613|nr:trigger factor [Candidatus Phytoplasma australasiaticum]MDO8061239.1 trigger factor [Candidatus Phytoplasma australasiaticum]MDV3137265.1 trigger factor [Candidatus Phytoplasma australasiaticum]MDV3142809.1 trigger factor [Candidatus Phytoplasma australasiaticum]MDV3152507.1 trigger factor [Candidatus Phytoplasma australasiaticum]MDV3156636.1 trigger factor [Candidatus Phytoplasma australasiaticum]